MKLNILKDLDKDQKSEMKEMFARSKRLREQMIKVLDDKIDAHLTSMLSKDQYNGDWAYCQANSLGYIRGLKELKSWLDDEKSYNLKRPMGRPKTSGLSILEN